MSKQDPVIWEIIGPRVKELRKERGWSQRRLAEAIGVSQTTVSELESGPRNPTATVIKGLSEVLEVSADHLLDTGHQGADPRADVLLSVLRRLSEEDRELVLEQARLLLKRAQRRELTEGG